MASFRDTTEELPTMEERKLRELGIVCLTAGEMAWRELKANSDQGVDIGQLRDALAPGSRLVAAHGGTCAGFALSRFPWAKVDSSRQEILSTAEESIRNAAKGSNSIGLGDSGLQEVLQELWLDDLAIGAMHKGLRMMEDQFGLWTPTASPYDERDLEGSLGSLVLEQALRRRMSEDEGKIAPVFGEMIVFHFANAFNWPSKSPRASETQAPSE